MMGPASMEFRREWDQAFTDYEVLGTYVMFGDCGSQIPRASVETLNVQFEGSMITRILPRQQRRSQYFAGSDSKLKAFFQTTPFQRRSFAVRFKSRPIYRRRLTEQKVEFLIMFASFRWTPAVPFPARTDAMAGRGLGKHKR